MLPVRLAVKSRVSVVKCLGEEKFMSIFDSTGVGTPNPCIVQEPIVYA